MAYAKPALRALDDLTGASSCNIIFQQSGCTITLTRLPPSLTSSCASVSTGEVQTLDPNNPVTLAPVASNTILGVNDGGVQVTPLANTGLPATQPIYVGVPVGTHGIDLKVTLTSASYAVDTTGFGATVAGNSVILGLP